jgi:hypothetical protein
LTPDAKNRPVAALRARSVKEKAIPLDLPSCGRGKKSEADGIWRTESALPAFFVIPAEARTQ